MKIITIYLINMVDQILWNCTENYLERKKISEIIMKYASERKLILYGGLAIHYLLKNASSTLGIYDSDVIADCDYYSSDYVTDSNDLADKLYETGNYENISVIHALHPFTRKVRVNMENGADISQLSLQIDTIDIITDEKINVRCTGLLFLRIPIYYVLSHPYGTELSPNIYTRYEKDEQRLKLLDLHCPIDNGNIYVSETGTKYIKCLTTIRSDLCVSGLLAYAYYYEMASVELKSKLIKITYDEKLSKLTYPMELNSDKILLTYYGDLSEILKIYPDAICRTGCTDLLPESVSYNMYEIYSCKLNVMCYHEFNTPTNTTMKKFTQLYQLAFLFGMYYYMFNKNSIYLQLVNSCRRMQLSNELKIYGYALQPFGDLQNNYRSQKYSWEISCRGRSDDRAPFYYPDRKIVELSNDDDKKIEREEKQNKLLNEYGYKIITKSELLAYY